MAARANWKGFLRVGELSCPVALFTASSSSERIAFHIVNRRTGRRVHRQFVDSETGDVVEAANQTKGYQTGDQSYAIIEPEEIAAAIPDSDKTLNVQSFAPCGSIDALYLDRPYYLAPTEGGGEAFALLREAMRARKVAAIARAVLFRRMRTLLVRPHDNGMIATTLTFDYEIRSAADAFADIPNIAIKGEMLSLAEHIIETKAGNFDAAAFDDRYENALADLVRAKQQGKPIKPKAPVAATNVADLMEALRQSAGAKPAAKKSGRRGQTAAKSSGKRKAG
jgi:DNA end-binding protein Ku